MITTNELLKRSKQLARKGLIMELEKLFIEFRNTGGTQEIGERVILQCIDELKIEDAEDSHLDEVRDFADTVFGWCTTEKRIWQT